MLCVCCIAGVGKFDNRQLASELIRLLACRSECIAQVIYPLLPKLNLHGVDTIDTRSRKQIDPVKEVSTEKLFFEPSEYYQSLLADISRAQHNIVLETYIFRFDDIGKEFVSMLNAALTRGVKVRILIDGVGSYFDAELIAQQLDSDNCQLRIFHPLPWDFRAYRRALNAGFWYSQILYFIASVNHRDHRKLCLIDNRVAWLGSFNITADHFNNSLHNADDNWHDTGVRITGQLVADLENNFEEVWQRKILPASQRSLQFLGNNSLQARINRNQRLLSILASAQHRIWICNAYFNPSYKLLYALRNAAIRGIDVRVLVPSRSDVSWFPFLTKTYYADLLNVGIKVFEYCNRTLHSKTILIDNQVLVGSTNLNYRSFFHDLELDALLSEPDSVQIMQSKFINDLDNSTEITFKHSQGYNWLTRALGWFSRFFRYWL